jgi:hypothetical protein
MSKKKSENTTVNGEVTPDDDNIVDPSLHPEADIDDDDDNFEFDSSLILAGVKLVDLAPDFVRPDGFLMVPRLNKKTGEIYPMTTTFAGILHDIIPWVDNRKKERVWFAFEATATVPDTYYTGRDEKNHEFKRPVEKGMRIGVSGSGAINALRTKKGHFALLHWTGSKVTVKNGDMWEVKAKVSDKPVIEVKE